MRGVALQAGDKVNIPVLPRRVFTTRLSAPSLVFPQGPNASPEGGVNRAGSEQSSTTSVRKTHEY